MSQRAEKDQSIYQLNDSQAEKVNSSLLPFCSSHTLIGLSEYHSHWAGQSALGSQPIQILCSSRNSLTDTPRTRITKYLGMSWPVKLTHNNNSHPQASLKTKLCRKPYWLYLKNPQFLISLLLFFLSFTFFLYFQRGIFHHMICIAYKEYIEDNKRKWKRSPRVNNIHPCLISVNLNT